MVLLKNGGMVFMSTLFSLFFSSAQCAIFGQYLVGYAGRDGVTWLGLAWASVRCHLLFIAINVKEICIMSQRGVLQNFDFTTAQMFKAKICVSYVCLHNDID